MVTVPRTRQSWESLIVGFCMSAVVMVVTVCIIVLAIYGTMFGAAQLRAHWP